MVASNSNRKRVMLTASEKTVKVAPDNPLHPGGITYNAMVFNGSIPGPVIAVEQDDIVEITLRNSGKMIYSLDLHVGLGPEQSLSGNVGPNQTKTWILEAKNAGAFLYHSSGDGLNGIWEHIANGMYGGIVVHPKNEKPAKEFYITFSEIYNVADKGPFVGSEGVAGSFDIGKMWNRKPDLILTNGVAHRYLPEIGAKSKIPLNSNFELFKVLPGELTRWYIVNAGPNETIAFNFTSTMINVKNGFVKNRYGTQILNDETCLIPPGSASVIETVFPSEGIYVGMDHNMANFLKGAGFAVLATLEATAEDHPPGTWVPSKGSSKTIGR